MLMWLFLLRVLHTLYLEQVGFYLLMHFKVHTYYQLVFFYSLDFALYNLWTYWPLESKPMNSTVQIVVIILMDSPFIYLT